PRPLHRPLRPFQFRLRAYEDPHFLWADPIRAAADKPLRDTINLCLFVRRNGDDGRGSVEDGDGAAPALHLAVRIRYLVDEQPVSVGPNLMGRAIVYPQRLGAPANVNPQCQPGEWMLKDALARVAGKEQPVRPRSPQGRQKAQFGYAHIL